MGGAGMPHLGRQAQPRRLPVCGPPQVTWHFYRLLALAAQADGAPAVSAVAAQLRAAAAGELGALEAAAALVRAGGGGGGHRHIRFEAWAGLDWGTLGKPSPLSSVGSFVALSINTLPFSRSLAPDPARRPCAGAGGAKSFAVPFLTLLHPLLAHTHAADS